VEEVFLPKRESTTEEPTMRKTILMILSGLLMTLFATSVYAKCYSGQDWKKGSKFYVCIKGAETWANRHKAEAVCKKIKGSKCDAVNTYSSSCNGHCYDASGKKHHSLSGY
jgi:hypothetical protein